MRVDRKKSEIKREASSKIDGTKLATVVGGLKAERVQGADPSGTGGT